MKKKAIIISIKSHKLSSKERKFLLTEKPWGLILFKRNIKSISQITNLTKKVRQLTKDRNFPIMLDEEGKTVTRLQEIIKNDVYQKLFGDLFELEPKTSISIYRKYINKFVDETLKSSAALTLPDRDSL